MIRMNLVYQCTENNWLRSQRDFFHRRLRVASLLSPTGTSIMPFSVSAEPRNEVETWTLIQVCLVDVEGCNISTWVSWLNSSWWAFASFIISFHVCSADIFHLLISMLFKSCSASWIHFLLSLPFLLVPIILLALNSLVFFPCPFSNVPYSSRS